MGAALWLKQGDERLGPLSDVVLRLMAKDALLRPDSLVSRDGLEWLPASQLSDLFPPATGQETPPPLPLASALGSAVTAGPETNATSLGESKLEAGKPPQPSIVKPPVLETPLDLAGPPVPLPPPPRPPAVPLPPALSLPPPVATPPEIRRPPPVPPPQSTTLSPPILNRSSAPPSSSVSRRSAAPVPPAVTPQLPDLPACLDLLAMPDGSSFRRLPFHRSRNPLLRAAVAGVLLGVFMTAALWCFGGSGGRKPIKMTVARGNAAVPSGVRPAADPSLSPSTALPQQPAVPKKSRQSAIPTSLRVPIGVGDQPMNPAGDASTIAIIPPFGQISDPPKSVTDRAVSAMDTHDQPQTPEPKPADTKPADPNAAPNAAKLAGLPPDPVMMPNKAMPQLGPAGMAKPAAVGGNANAADAPAKPMGPPPAVNERAGKRVLVLDNGGTRESEAAVETALAWLVAHQLGDGGWSFNHQHGYCHCPDPGMMADARNAATAMALLPFLAAGYSHEHGPYKDQIWAGLSYLIAHIGPEGSLWEPGGTMYSHGLATTVLCEAYNLSDKPTPEDYRSWESMPVAPPAKRDAKDQKLADVDAAKTAKAEAFKAAKAERAAKAGLKPADAKAAGGTKTKSASSAEPTAEAIRAKKIRGMEIGAAAQKALNYIVAAQNPTTGGWRYNFGDEGDTSVVGWQLMALKAGQLAKLQVPEQTMAGASLFLDSVQSDYGSQYGYTHAARGTPATTAIGLLARENLGWDATNRGLLRGAEMLAFEPPSQDDMYYNFYASQVLRNIGGIGWEKWNSLMRDYLVKSQFKKGHMTGSWMFEGLSPHARHGSQDGGRLYNTALCTLILQVYYRHDPTYYPYKRPKSTGSLNQPRKQERPAVQPVAEMPDPAVAVEKPAQPDPDKPRRTIE